MPVILRQSRATPNLREMCLLIRENSAIFYGFRVVGLTPGQISGKAPSCWKLQIGACFFRMVGRHPGVGLIEAEYGADKANTISH